MSTPKNLTPEQEMVRKNAREKASQWSADNPEKDLTRQIQVMAKYPEIVDLLMEGKSLAAIAMLTGISIPTVRVVNFARVRAAKIRLRLLETNGSALTHLTKIPQRAPSTPPSRPTSHPPSRNLLAV